MKSKIAIVEDDPSILLGLETLLKAEGFTVASCDRGDKAAEFVTRQQPHLIILDGRATGCSFLRRRTLRRPGHDHATHQRFWS